MKVLVLTKKFPYPLKDGESIAVTNLSREMVAAGCEITLLSMNTAKHFIDTEQLPPSYDHFVEMHTVYLDNRVTAWGAFSNLFSHQSYHVSRFYFEAYRLRLVQLLQSEHFDVVQLETLYLAPYVETIREHSDALVVMRSHNVEFEIWERVTASTQSILKRTYLQYLTTKLRKFEIARMSQYDALVTVTERDLKRHLALGYAGPGMASPIGLNIDHYTAQPIDAAQLSFSFIGSLDWMPNLDGLQWFLTEVWPDIRKAYPEATFHIAGRNTPESIRHLASEEVVIHGEVEDAHAFLNAHPITVVPLLSGSGMRVKILEGMALGRVVISTTIGAEGIPAQDREEILIADTKTEILSSLAWLAEDDIRLRRIGAAARNFIAEHFDQMENARRLIRFYEGLK